MALTPLPDPPQTADPANFATKADALVAALATMVSEINGGAIEFNGGTLTTSPLDASVSTFALLATPTTVTAFGGAATLGLGAATGTLTVNNATLAAKAITASNIVTITKALGTTVGSAEQLKLSSGASGDRVGVHLTDGVTSDAYITYLPSASAASRFFGIKLDALNVLVFDGNGLMTIPALGGSGAGYVKVDNSGNLSWSAT